MFMVGLNSTEMVQLVRNDWNHRRAESRITHGDTGRRTICV